MDRIDHPQRVARTAGVLYLAIIVCGIWADGFVRSSLIVASDAQATAANISAAMQLFRLSMVADTIMMLCDVGLAVLLYVLLRPVSPTGAMLATAFRLTQAAVLGANLLNLQFVVMFLANGGGLDAEHRDALALLFAQAHGTGYDIGLLFFGINCLVTGYLVYRSGFLPRFLGVLILGTGPVYLIGSYLKLLAPVAAEAFQPAYLLPVLAETTLCLWLLIKGVAARDGAAS